MKITAITRYKHGELYSILKRIGWTQSELARQTKISICRIGDIINLVTRPTSDQADAIQKAIGTAGEYLDVLSEWPESFDGLKRGYKREQTSEVPMERLIFHPEVLQLAAAEYDDDNSLEERMKTEISELTQKQKIILRERFWNSPRPKRPFATAFSSPRPLQTTRSSAALSSQSALRSLTSR